MAITFKLKYGDPSSWSYIDLTDSDHGMVDYVPQAPAEGAAEQVESGTWRVHGSTLANLIAAVEAIENVFRRAAEYDAEQVGTNQVFVTATYDGGSTIYESEIYEGKVQLPATIFREDWANFEANVVITWRRAVYWERIANAYMINSNGNTDYLHIFNCDDGSGASPNKKENFADLASGYYPAGDLPAPVMVLLTGVANNVDEIYVYQNAKSNPTTVVYLAEVGTAGDTADANRSGGYYKTVAVPAAGTGYDVETGSVNLADLKGGAWLRFLLSAKFNGTVKARPYVSVNGIKYYGPASILTCDNTYFELFDLGLVRLPESASFVSSQFAAVVAGINLYSTPGLNVSVDYFQYSPIDSFLHAKLDKAVSLSTDVIFLDSKNQTTFAYTSAASKITTLGTLFGGINLEPGVVSRLIFKFKSGKNDDMALSAFVTVIPYLRKKTL